ncbi:MAG TPA: PIG-L family deacetylase [Bryobacteraceae bacterium]|nr:PIG-L family deacetylase [Bryobacteraceae bacterium]
MDEPVSAYKPEFCSEAQIGVMRVLVLSPHRDDAVFSLFFTLSELSRRGAQISVRNFFTDSNYAPHAGTHDAAAVSQIRKREDRAALRRIHSGVRVLDSGLLDAPLRLGIPARQVCYTEVRECDIALLRSFIRPQAADLVFAPLGLGGHVDHRTVRQAALLELSRKRLAFYEDLPYTMWSQDQLPSLLGEIERQLDTILKPAEVQPDQSFFEKRSACARYRSQIRMDEANAMAAWSRRHGTAERIWLPRGVRLPL